jgi:hypothetical protein
MTVYVDGKIIGIDVFLTKPSEMPLFFIGASGNPSKDGPEVVDCFKGAIDEVKIYDRELSPGEVAENYNALKQESK